MFIEGASRARYILLFLETNLLFLLEISGLMGGFGKPLPAYTTSIAGH